MEDWDMKSFNGIQIGKLKKKLSGQYTPIFPFKRGGLRTGLETLIFHEYNRTRKEKNVHILS